MELTVFITSILLNLLVIKHVLYLLCKKNFAFFNKHISLLLRVTKALRANSVPEANQARTDSKAKLVNLVKEASRASQEPTCVATF